MKHIIRSFKKKFQNIKAQIMIRYLLVKMRIRLNQYKRAMIVAGKRSLDQCQDEESKRLRAQALEKEIHSEFQSLRLIFSMTRLEIEMYCAINAQYDYLKNPNITKEDHDMAPQNFKQAKENLIMKAKWAIVSDKEYVYLHNYICKLEPVEFDAFTSRDEWYKFFHELHELLKDPKRKRKEQN